MRYITSQQRIYHFQYGSFSRAVLSVQQCNPIVQIQVDMVVVHAEQTFDFDVLEAEVLRLVHLRFIPLYS